MVLRPLFPVDGCRLLGPEARRIADAALIVVEIAAHGSKRRLTVHVGRTAGGSGTGRHLAKAVRDRIAGPQFQAVHDRIWNSPGPRWFTEATPSGGCTRTPRCSSAASVPCCSSRCIRWPCSGSASIPVSAATRGGGCSEPAGSSRRRPTATNPTLTGASPSSGPCTVGYAGPHPAVCPTGPTIRICWPGSTPPRSTASWPATRLRRRPARP